MPDNIVIPNGTTRPVTPAYSLWHQHIHTPRLPLPEPAGQLINRLSQIEWCLPTDTTAVSSGSSASPTSKHYPPAFVRLHPLRIAIRRKNTEMNITQFSNHPFQNQRYHNHTKEQPPPPPHTMVYKDKEDNNCRFIKECVLSVNGKTIIDKELAATVVEQENEEDNSRFECIVCFEKKDNEDNVIIMPCNHSDVCRTCVLKWYYRNTNFKCFLCNSKIYYIKNIESQTKRSSTPPQALTLQNIKKGVIFVYKLLISRIGETGGGGYTTRFDEPNREQAS